MNLFLKHYITKNTSNIIPNNSKLHYSLFKNKVTQTNFSNIHIRNNLVIIMKLFFNQLSILISEPKIRIHSNKINIVLIYYSSSNILTNNKFKPSTTIFNKYNTGKDRYIWDNFINNLLSNKKIDTSKFNSQWIKNNILPEQHFNQSNDVSNLIKDVNSSKLFLASLLSKIFTVNIELELIPLKYVYQDASILAQFIGIHSHDKTYGQLKKTLFNEINIINQSDSLFNSLDTNKNTNLISELSGIQIRIAGRLNKQRITPKQTIKTSYKGTISARKYIIVDKGFHVDKNKKGAYAITTWLGHRIKY